MLASLRTNFFLPTFYVFSELFQKNVKSHVFLKSEKNEKYVFSNTDHASPRMHWCTRMAILYVDVGQTYVNQTNSMYYWSDWQFRQLEEKWWPWHNIIYSIYSLANTQLCWCAITYLKKAKTHWNSLPAKSKKSVLMAHKVLWIRTKCHRTKCRNIRWQQIWL